MPSPLQIVSNTPLWVWGILTLVLWLGWIGLRPRVFSPARLGILPLVGLVMSLTGLAQSAQPYVSGAAWLAALVLALPLGHLIGRRRAIRVREDGQLELAGSPFILLFGLSIFAARYAFGVLFGVHPELAAETTWLALAAAVGGAFAGIGLGWLSTLLARGRRARTALA